MNETAFQAAKQKLQIAREKVAEMRLSHDIRTLSRLWEEFLTIQQQVFLRLRKAFEHGASKAWSDAVVNEQRSDNMLQYVLHARNVDEHGIENITEIRPGSLTINPREGNELFIKNMTIRTKGPTSHIAMDQETAANAVIAFTPGSIKLIPVRDRGILYNPPTNHMDQQISNPSPLSVAELTLVYLTKKIQEAEEKFTPIDRQR